jgi:hypothetical protein
VPVLLVAGLAGLAAVEELAITATTRTLDLDRRSLRASGGSLSG